MAEKPPSNEPRPAKENIVQRSRREPKPQLVQIDKKIKELNDQRPKPTLSPMPAPPGGGGPDWRASFTAADHQKNTRINREVKQEQENRARIDWAIKNSRGKLQPAFDRARTPKQR